VFQARLSSTYKERFSRYEPLMGNECCATLCPWPALCPWPLSVRNRDRDVMHRFSIQGFVLFILVWFSRLHISFIEQPSF